jgi:hypothetical protein
MSAEFRGTSRRINTCVAMPRVNDDCENPGAFNTRDHSWSALLSSLISFRVRARVDDRLIRPGPLMEAPVAFAARISRHQPERTWRCCSAYLSSRTINTNMEKKPFRSELSRISSLNSLIKGRPKGFRHGDETKAKISASMRALWRRKRGSSSRTTAEDTDFSKEIEYG